MQGALSPRLYRHVPAFHTTFTYRYCLLGLDPAACFVRRDDVLPCRLYLRHCVLAARGLGSSVALDSFLDSTFLASGHGGNVRACPALLCHGSGSVLVACMRFWGSGKSWLSACQVFATADVCWCIRPVAECCLQADRKTTVRMYLERNPDIMDEEPPPELRERYSG